MSLRSDEQQDAELADFITRTMAEEGKRYHKMDSATYIALGCEADQKSDSGDPNISNHS
jgi:predicted transcriptional regulator